jgi:hypothetical protein
MAERALDFNTWLDRYYPVPACEVAYKPGVTAIELVLHTLRKWVGLRRETLQKYGLRKVGRQIESICCGDGSLLIAGTSCSLCLTVHCTECHLYTYLGRRCDHLSGYDDPDSLSDGPYTHWDAYNDPEPMIRALAGLLTMLRQRAQQSSPGESDGV